MPNAFGYTAASTSGYQKSSRKRFRSIAMRNNVLPLVIVIQATFISVLLISHRSDSSMLRRARLEDLNNNARPLRYAVQQEPPSEHVAVTHHAQPLALAEDTSQHDANSAHIPEAPPVEARDVTHAGLRMNPSKEVAPVQHNENEPASDKPKRELPVPDECAVWKSVAKDTSKLRLYRKHFVSHDLTDWFLYVAIFDDMFHETARKTGRKLRYLDLAANHARRWSNTYFFDRCQGWDGVCIEPNDKYHEELSIERSCKLVKKCISDVPRKVRFAFSGAFGGVISNQGYGVNEKKVTIDKQQHYTGTKELMCTTLSAELEGEQHFDFMSLDVESFEMPVLLGMDWTRTKIDVIVIENKSPEVVKLLTSVGYKRFQVMKDDLYIREDSGYSVNPKFVNWYKNVDRTTGAVHV